MCPVAAHKGPGHEQFVEQYGQETAKPAEHKAAKELTCRVAKRQKCGRRKADGTVEVPQWL